MMHSVDFLVLGSGVAGLSFALEACKHGRVAVLTKTRMRESNSSYAQGGIAAVWSEDDNLDNHMQDTFVAGAGLCRPEAVEQTVREASERIRELIRRGAQFTRSEDDPERYDLHREGGHSHRRILHAADLTGAELVRALTEAALAEPQIEILEDRVGVDLITRSWLARREQHVAPADDAVVGAYVLNAHTGEVEAWAARFVVLATGGAGRLYRFTTNPSVATGDGMAMAWRAGAEIANMEFFQFHPTALYHPQLRSYLISEALRGEGGILRLPNGERFMPRYDERAELAPRDIVARAIDAEIKKNGLECVHLDMTHMTTEQFETHFPNIYANLKSVGIDPSKDPIPVVPAAHYCCGGVRTDLEGCTSVGRLLAIGETACTGLHGANRLASNSLLEASVFGHHAALYCIAHADEHRIEPSLPDWDASEAADPDERVVIHQVWEEIRRFMWNYVGIVRTSRRMERARRRIALVQEEIDAYYWDFKLSTELIELRNLATVAELVVRCAQHRQESRGLHYTLDFPETDARFQKDTVISKFV